MTNSIHNILLDPHQTKHILQINTHITNYYYYTTNRMEQRSVVGTVKLGSRLQHQCDDVDDNDESTHHVSASECTKFHKTIVEHNYFLLRHT